MFSGPSIWLHLVSHDESFSTDVILHPLRIENQEGNMELEIEQLEEQIPFQKSIISYISC